MPDAVNSMNTSLARHPDVWLVVDVDPKSMDPIIKKAIAAGITVIDINSRGDVTNPPYAFYIGSDALLEGEMAGKTVWTASGGKLKRAVCANQVLGDVTLELRCKGYRTVLQSHHVKVDEIDISGGPTQAQAKTQAYFTAHKDSGALYTLSAGPEAFDPALAALKKLHLNKKVKFVANDLSTPALKAVKSGDVVGLIDQQEYLQGYLGVQWAWLYKMYGMVPGGGQILTGPALVTKAQVNRVIGPRCQGLPLDQIGRKVVPGGFARARREPVGVIRVSRARNKTKLSPASGGSCRARLHLGRRRPAGDAFACRVGGRCREDRVARAVRRHPLRDAPTRRARGPARIRDGVERLLQRPQRKQVEPDAEHARRGRPCPLRTPAGEGRRRRRELQPRRDGKVGLRLRGHAADQPADRVPQPLWLRAYRAVTLLPHLRAICPGA